MKFVRLIPVAATSLLLLAGCGDKKPPLAPALKQAMETRHDGFEALGDAMKSISDTLKAGGSLNPELAASAKKINEIAPQLADWFPAGSGPESGHKTEAKAEIWSQPELFTEKREAFVAAAAKLAELADANDAAGFAAQVSEVGGACKGCHDQFREKKK